MAILDIYEYPDPELRQLAEPVTDFGPDLQRHIDDIVETLYANRGAVGLAATQVGVPYRIFAMDLHPGQPESDLKISINPVILRSSKWKMSREGCLSFPQYLATVKRAKRLRLGGCDRNGQPFEWDLEGFAAVVVQHELDHLDGVLMIDRIRSIGKDLRLREPASPFAAEEHPEPVESAGKSYSDRLAETGCSSDE